VHAKGAGAGGEFVVTHDITHLTSANFLSEVGKKTKAFARFSTVGGESGSADTARDPRGFSVKFYTEEGNLDYVFNNTPVFFLRDPAKFPVFIHTQKRNPKTHLKDATMFWDYLSTNPESFHQIMHLFSDRGTPASFRHMNGYSGHVYKFVKADGTFNYVQIHFKADGGTKTLTNDEAGKLAGEAPDYLTKDLFDNIAEGNFPSWTACVQVMSSEEAEKFRFNIFDLTKVWPQAEFPLQPFGKLTLNRNPENYFAEVEQVAFSPSHTVPGWTYSADPVLQSRLFSYPDTHRHRLGVNYQQIPVNCPLNAYSPYQRDGLMTVNGNYGADANYPSSFQPITYKHVPMDEKHEKWIGEAVNYEHPVTDDDFVQPKALWEVLGKQPGQQDNFVYNVSGHLCNAKQSVQEKTFEVFGRIDKTLGQRVKDATLKNVQGSRPENEKRPRL